MTFPTHIILGLVIGKVIGNYPIAIASSMAIDIDHLQSYIKSGVIFKPKLFWKTINDKADPYGDQRGYLHNFFIFTLVSVILLFIFGDKIFPLVFGWLGHLFLDALDNSDYWPFYPYKRINLRGFIRFASYQEFIFAIFLLSFYFII
ncbi:MAG: metal-dependent hydrolase [Candidatus Paceibacterota bacterium]|jgi:membrane-bound metal-dependent hydrolase YbcI (DUF457 family)